MTDRKKQIEEAAKYPCDKCGKLRTEAEGGTTFTVCDACWADANPPKAEEIEPEDLATETVHTLAYSSPDDERDDERFDALEYVDREFPHAKSSVAIELEVAANFGFLAGRKGYVPAAEVKRAVMENDCIWREQVAEAVRAERERCAELVKTFSGHPKLREFILTPTESEGGNG